MKKGLMFVLCLLCICSCFCERLDIGEISVHSYLYKVDMDAIFQYEPETDLYFLSVQYKSDELYFYEYTKEAFLEMRDIFEKAERWRVDAYTSGIEIEKVMTEDISTTLVTDALGTLKRYEELKNALVFTSLRDGKVSYISFYGLDTLYIDLDQYPYNRITDARIKEAVDDYLWEKERLESGELFN